MDVHPATNRRRPETGRVRMGAVDFGVLEEIKHQLAQLTNALPRMIEDRVRAVLGERDVDSMGGLAQLAQWLSAPSADAAAKRVMRDPELAALAVRGAAGGHRRWRKSEVLAMLARRH